MKFKVRIFIVILCHKSLSMIVECVPNFSEGRDLNIIKQITDGIEKVDGVRLLNVDRVRQQIELSSPLWGIRMQ